MARGQSAGEKWVDSLGMAFVWIPPGRFWMGSLEFDDLADDHEKPLHQVTISHGYWLGQYPVTQAQWHAVMGDDPSYFTGEKRPVEHVSWDQAQAFATELNHRRPGQGYRLPTEAEWEYACRAGSTTSYSFGDDEGALAAYGWHQGNADRQTHPVGELQPNAWGLYDMHGNVWEWCQDWMGPYPAGAEVDPAGPPEGDWRVLRGGSWLEGGREARSSSRFAVGRCSTLYIVGFRLVRVPPSRHMEPNG